MPSQKNLSLVTAKTKTIIRILIALVAVLIFGVSYYQSQYRIERRRYNQLEDKYVRVRMMLGREEMQRLIDDSYDL